MTDRELMQQALEALEEISGGYSQNLIVALRERLAQPEQPEQEPAYRCRPYSSVPNAKVSPPVDYYTTPQPRTWAGSRRSPAWWETSAPQPRTWAGSGDLEDSNAYLTTPQRKPEQEPVVWALPKMHPVMELRLRRRFRVR